MAKDEANKLLEDSALKLAVQMDDTTKEALDLEAGLEVLKKDAANLSVAMDITSDASVDLAREQERLAAKTRAGIKSNNKLTDADSNLTDAKEQESKATIEAIKRRAELAAKLNEQMKVVDFVDVASKESGTEVLNEVKGIKEYIKVLIDVVAKSGAPRRGRPPKQKTERVPVSNIPTPGNIVEQGAPESALSRMVTKQVSRISDNIEKLTAGITEPVMEKVPQKEISSTEKSVEKEKVMERQLPGSKPDKATDTLVNVMVDSAKADNKERTEAKLDRTENKIARKEQSAFGDKLLGNLIEWKTVQLATTMLTSPIVWVAGIIAAVVAFKDEILTWLKDNWDKLVNKIGELWDVTKDLASKFATYVGAAIKNALGSVLEGLMRGINSITKWAGIGPVFKELDERDEKEKQERIARGEEQEEKSLLDKGMEIRDKGLQMVGSLFGAGVDAIKSTESGKEFVDTVSSVVSPVFEKLTKSASKDLDRLEKVPVAGKLVSWIRGNIVSAATSFGKGYSEDQKISGTDTTASQIEVAKDNLQAAEESEKIASEDRQASKTASAVSASVVTANMSHTTTNHNMIGEMAHVGDNRIPQVKRGAQR